jgi:imidazoleglycerol-phosphate dehydratase
MKRGKGRNNGRSNGRRQASVTRTTSETKVTVSVVLDGRGEGQVNTTIPFLDHMLMLLAKHGLFDLTIQAKGDTDIDDHHTVEDIGIVLGTALKQAVGMKPWRK